MEEWKTIKDFPNYEVSNIGRVRSKEAHIKFKNNYQEKIITKIKKQRIGTNHYKITDLYNNYSQTTKSVHRLVCETFIPNKFNKPFVNHKDGNKLNNNVNNLEWCTPKENSQHAARTGLITCKGENHHNAKLTRSEAKQIIYMIFNSCFNQNEIANLYNISIAQVSRIKTGKRWKNLKREVDNIWQTKECFQK